MFGARSRVPMLWVYADNDHFFGPKLAQELRKAFTAGGGTVEFVAAPAFGEDGHHLFSVAGIPIWTKFVDDFLKRENLARRDTLLPLPRPALTAPAALLANGRRNFEDYLIAGPHKAFAMSPQGAFAWVSGARTTDAARPTRSNRAARMEAAASCSWTMPRRRTQRPSIERISPLEEG